MLRSKRILILTAIGALCFACQAAALPHSWSKSFGDAENQYAPYVATDNLGNVWVTGSYNGGIDLGGLGFWSEGQTDIFLAKYDPDGNHLWSDSFGGPLSHWVYGIAVDAAGNVIIAGDFHYTVDFGGGTLTASGDGDIFLAKFDSAGNHLWSQRFGDGWDQVAYDVAVDDAGNILLTGAFNGSVNFGGGSLSAQIETPDVFVAKFDPNGNHIWSQDFGDYTNWQLGTSIAVDGADNVIVTGEYGGNINFGGGSLPTAVYDQQDMFLVQFDPSGNHNWSHGFTASSYEICHDVTVDSEDGIFVTGGFSGTLDLGDGALAAVGGGDIFLARFDQNGALMWADRYGSTGGQTAKSVVANGAGNVFITGSFGGSVDFGGGLLTSAGSNDVFVAQFDLEGYNIGSNRYGDASSQQGHDLAMYGEDNLYLTGQFLGTVSFGGSMLACAGGTDIFVAKFGEPSSSGYTVAEYVSMFDDPPYMLVEVALQWDGPGTAYEVSARMGEDTSWLRLMDAYCYYGNIPAGESSWGADNDVYTLYLTSGYPGGRIDVWLDVEYVDAGGSIHNSQLPLTIDPDATGVNESADMIHADIRLLPNWPNPFNPSTSIRFELPAPEHASLRIYDLGGRLVRTLVDDRLAADSHVVEWNGRDDRGGTLPSGTYIYRLQAGKRVATRKLVLVE